LKSNSATLSSEAFADAAESPSAAPPAPAPTRTVGVTLALGVLRLYKLILSPLFAGSCRFYPSCADYAAEAVERHGVGPGSWLAARRLIRCHPFCDGGHDAVPPRA
jgi:putative membrane protein insertion efficiency factor